ncbi:uncharacterized protein N0V89_002923 [Didymosphaeria variabile]|uniref:Uncharacterized protein n=1 Tax=Didymosphaeria variabile TaxID=1932322 RepID=A0A9W9CE28_9PLEO|nr:uncharacterized protein N0V89_002923 [Didymosphaeria variabile]KAJ4358341.1 hypothetical protein N0V89_002923 [Didymosphaeria variabile]
MAPSSPIFAMRMVTSILLLSSIAYASVLPPHKIYNRHLPNTINVRAPTEDAAITHNVDDVAIVANEKKDGKNFFKELGNFLSEFDPVDIFRTILGGLLGLKVDDATNGSSSSPTTTVSITPTPIEATLSTVKTTSTKTVTTTQLRKSSTRAELAFSILPIFPTEEPLELTGLAPTRVFTPHHIIFTPGASASVDVAASVHAEVSVKVLPSGPFINTSAGIPAHKPTPIVVFDNFETSATPLIDDFLSAIETDGAPDPENLPDLIATAAPVNATTAPNATASGITVTYEPEETFSILPFIPPGEDLADNVTNTGPFNSSTAPITATGEVIESSEPEETFSILPFYSSGKGWSDIFSLPATVDEIPPLETFEVVTTPVTDVPGATLLPVQTEEIFSILPFYSSGKGWADIFSLPATVDEIPPLETFEVVTTPVTDVPGATLLPVQTEEIFSILPFYSSGKGWADIFSVPATADEIPPLETFEVVTTPVTDVPGATLLPVETVEPMSILPFFGPGEHLSDNVTMPTPTEQVPELPIPVFTGLEESLNAFAGEDVAITMPAEVEANTPLETDGPDSNDRAPVPLLELVNGTYVLPATKKPDFVTPVLSWPPPGFNVTAKPAVSTRRGPPRKTSSRRSALPTWPNVFTPLRPTKPIVLPPPLIRPTNFPLNQTFFANQTNGAASAVAKSSRPLILTNPLRPTVEALPLPRPFPLPGPIPPFPLAGPFFNNTRGIRPIGRPTRPFILTDPLRTTPESFPTLILASSPRPPIETFEPLDARSTTTRTLKIRSTTIKTVIVMPTPVGDVPDVSVLGVDVPADEPLPSDAGFVGPEFPFDEGEDIPVSENPRPTLPINDFDDPDVSNGILSPTATLIINDFDDFDVSSDTLRPTIAPILGDVGELDIPSDLVEPSAAPIIDDFGEFNFSVALSAPTPVETDVSLPDVPPSFVDSLKTFTTIANVLLHPGLGVKATGSAELDIALLEDTTFPSDLVVSKLPLFTPTPTPRDSVKRLAEICGDGQVTTVTLPLLQSWYGPNAYPSLRSYPGCAPANPRQAIQAPGLLNCTALGREVQTCQKAGKRVLLGIRADAPSAVNGNLKWGSADPGVLGLKLPLPLPPGPFLGRPGHPIFPQAGNLTTVKVDGKTVPAPNLFDALHTPTGLAATLFSLFGEGHAERADLRPLGPDAPSNFSSDKIMWVAKPLGEEVVVDGFDVRTPGQWKGTPQAALVERFVSSLKESVEKAWKEEGVKGGLNDLGVDGPGEVVSGYI